MIHFLFCRHYKESTLVVANQIDSELRKLVADQSDFNGKEELLREKQQDLRTVQEDNVKLLNELAGKLQIA